MKKAEEIAINLANRLFNHFLIIIYNVLPNHINSANVFYDTINTDLFTHIGINQYLFDKFYKIMIDTNTSKYFKAGYRQFKAYTKDI